MQGRRADGGGVAGRLRPAAPPPASVVPETPGRWGLLPRQDTPTLTHWMVLGTLRLLVVLVVSDKTAACHYSD